MPDAPLRELTTIELADYDRDGVVCARGLFPRVWVDRMADAIDDAVEEPTAGGRALSIPERGYSGDLFLWKLLDVFRDFVYDSPAAAIAQQLFRSRRVNFFYDQLFVKSAGCDVATPWHQDIVFWPIEGSQVCSIWLTFDPVDRESSGLEFVRGSHRWPQRFKAVTPEYNVYSLGSDPEEPPGVEAGPKELDLGALVEDSDLEEPPDVDARREDFDIASWDMERGDALLFDARILHGSGGNPRADRARRALSTRWTGDDVVYAPQPTTMPLLWRHGLAPGDPIGGPLFPRIRPEPLASEGARRAQGPEPVDPDMVRSFLEGLR